MTTLKLANQSHTSKFRTKLTSCDVLGTLPSVVCSLTESCPNLLYWTIADVLQVGHGLINNNSSLNGESSS
jgi:hypothetical protein